ncbi:TIGR02266 family protein [Vitiosangium sp. GDMCC 1.1324]|uniref:TIGR02266 family protein n=1 Tax=Vitiosangium sp. (strain GDMCC 1.1324) TaxID=2138576 RepID=UPI000D358A9A|nr:TIGR02266 family protein [Vitiosangium sp. GDMCC 1.1324]PTL76996.1 TIGR02266 family protein [Vitiosangium sp. GDMCC 1.1324]
MNAPSPAPSHPPPRESELARAEAEQASQEARLAEQLNRAATEAESLSRRLTELRQQVSRVPAERQTDEHVRGASARLESASVHTGSTEDARERGLAARHEALEARRRASQEAQAALQSLQLLNTRAQQDLGEAEAGLKRSAEAAARAQREREAAAKAAQAAQARQTAPAHRKAPAQENLTIPEPRPLGARSSRVRMQTAIDMRSDSNFFTGFATNISEGGIFVATVQSVPRGTTVDLDFTLPGGRPMKVSGVVRWTREVNDKTPELMPGLGVQFSNLPPEVVSAISDFVATREPMFFPD